ncbi:host attachment protein [Microbaculum marinum]|uniref:Host attachment protein n=1 Tax=Microbaculum marinum TaxID=1764581 RepID=A0AAW9RS98_9HYPH
MVRKIVTWVVVADGARARVFVNEGVGKGVHELEDRAFIGDRRQNRDIQSDRPGRSFDSGGQGRHAMEPRTDPHKHEEHRFLGDVVDWLTGHARQDEFERLVLIAAPRALGELRSLMSKPLAARVVAEIDKDLTQAGPAEIESHLGDVLAV